MAIINYNTFKKIFNEVIFESSKADLLQKVANYPNRYIGLFRIRKTKLQILQNLFKFQEIRFGKAFELIIEEYLKNSNFNILPKKFKLNNDNIIYYIEKKFKDNFNSKKSIRHINNFEQKLFALSKEYKGKKIVGIFYFIDPDLVKNKNYYLEELSKISKDYKIQTYLFYGESLFEFLKIPDVWKEIISHLEQWKKQVPELPEINFDIDAKNTFNEIKDLNPSIYRKLLANDEIINDILFTLFPEKKTLKLLYKYFQTKEETIYHTISKRISELF